MSLWKLGWGALLCYPVSYTESVCPCLPVKWTRLPSLDCTFYWGGSCWHASWFFLSFLHFHHFLPCFCFQSLTLTNLPSLSHVTLSREQCFSKTANFWPLSSNNILVNGPVNTSIIAFNQFLKLYSLCV